jgi:hypothetical protein
MSSGREVESDNTVTSSRIFWVFFLFCFVFRFIPFIEIDPFSRGFCFASPRHHQSPSPLHCPAAFPTPPCMYELILNPVGAPSSSFTLSLFIIIRSFRSIGASLEFHSGLTQAARQLFQLTPFKKERTPTNSIPFDCIR